MNKFEEKLREQYEENKSNINVFDARRSVLHDNRKDQRVIMKLGFSVFALLIPTAIIAFGGDISLITNLIPAEFIPYTFIGSSLVTGFLAENLFERSSKKTLRKFSEAKTEEELIEAETRYEIALEFSKNYNKAIEAILEKIEGEKSLLRSLSKNYNISDKNIDKYSIDQLSQNVKELENKFEEAIESLVTATERKTLHYNLGGYKTATTTILNAVAISEIGGLVSMMIIGFTLNKLGSPVEISTLFSPFAVSSVVGGTFASIKAKNQNKVFKKLNKELKEDSLPKKVTTKEEIQIREDVDRKIQEVCIIGFKLYEQYNLLEKKESTVSEKQPPREDEKILQVRKEYRPTVIIPDELIKPPETQITEKPPVKKIGQKNNL